MSLFEHQWLRIAGIEYNATIAGRDTLPTAYAPATITRSMPAGLDNPDPARLTVPITLPPENAEDAQYRRFNMHPNPRYIGPDGVAGGGSASWTQVDTTQNAPDGGGRTAIIATSDATGVVDVGTDEPASVAVTPGATYTGSAYGRTSRDLLPYMFVYLNWRDASGNGVGSHESERVNNVPNGQWFRMSITAVAPANAATVQVRVRFGYAAAVPANNIKTNDEITVAQRMVEESPVLTPYFDGDYPDTVTHTYNWIGDPNASPSGVVTNDLRPKVGDELAAKVRFTNPTATNPAASFLGRVESVERAGTRTMYRADGTTFEVVQFDVAASDYIAVLARRRLADTPWPEELAIDRWTRIANLVAADIPIELTPRASDDNVNCAARDVDNTSALQVLQDSISIVDGVVMMIGDQVAAGPRNIMCPAPDDLTTLELPGAAFEDPGDVQDYDMLVNVVRITGKQFDATDGRYTDDVATFTDAASRTEYGESTWTVSGDGMASFAPGGTIENSLVGQRAARLVATTSDATTPSWRLAGPVTAIPHVWAADPGEKPDDEFLQGPGLGMPVRFVGAPAGRDLFRVIGMTFTWGGARHEALELELEPVHMTASIPI